MTASSRIIPAIRSEFPRAETDGSGRRRVFFDAGAGSLVLRRVAEAEAKSRVDYSANIGAPSWESQMNEATIQEGRKAVRDFINAESEDCIVSGESATHLIFHLSYALGKELPKDSNVVVTEYDHDANVSPWLELERRGVIEEVRHVKFDPQTGMLDLEQLASLADEKTKVVSVAGISNALGTKTPLHEFRRVAREVGAYFVVDAVHMAAHMPIDVKEIGCDFLIFSAYKLFSRRGSFMYGRKQMLEDLSPYKVDMCPDRVPINWEWGTRDQSLFAAITATIDYLTWLGEVTQSKFAEKVAGYPGRQKHLKAAMMWVEDYEETLTRAMLSGFDNSPSILEIPGVDLYGPRDPSRARERAPTFTFNLKGRDPRKLAGYLWEKHAVAVLPDDFYSRALKTYGVSKAVRASLAHYNTVKEVRTFLLALDDAARSLT